MARLAMKTTGAVTRPISAATSNLFTGHGISRIGRKGSRSASASGKLVNGETSTSAATGRLAARRAAGASPRDWPTTMMRCGVTP
jgi:hypothetical protein